MPRDAPVFVDPWLDLRSSEAEAADSRSSITEELVREIAIGHLIFGEKWGVLAKSTASDAVCLELERDRFAVVHLTWSGHAELPPWPRTEVFETAGGLEAAISEA